MLPPKRFLSLNTIFPEGFVVVQVHIKLFGHARTYLVEILDEGLSGDIGGLGCGVYDGFAIFPQQR
jgi:hypothetical protein